MEILSLIGVDKNILSLCSKREQKLYQFFNYMQLFLIIIIGLSTYYIIDIIFNNSVASILLGLFWAFVFFNLYRFILLTITGKKAKNKKERVSIIFPNLFKIGVISIFAVFISFPIELFLNENYIEKNLPDILNSKIEFVKLELDSIYLTRETELKAKINFYQTQLDNLGLAIKEEEDRLSKPEYIISENQIKRNIISLSNELELKKKKFIPIISEKKSIIEGLRTGKQKEVEQYKRIIKNSSLLIERFAILFRKKPVAESFFTLLIILLFLSPLLYKLISIYYHGFKYEKFNTEKMRQEIVCNYEIFKLSYREITNSIYGQEIEYLELYSDPPFNTIKKTDKRKKELKGSFSSFLSQNHQG